MARSLVQALEGIAFPCDRSKLIEYARTNDAASRAIDSLAAIPERQYANMTEVLSEVPSKTGRRRVAHPQGLQPEPEPTPHPDFGEVAPSPQEIGPAMWTLGWEWSQTYLRLMQRVWLPWLR